MREAINLALKAQGKTSPNPMVGALLVKGNRIIARGYHHRVGKAHAEIIALQKAGMRARGATLYVTLEPCSHYGRTPPCVDAVIKAGIKRVIIGAQDQNPLTNGTSIRKLRKHGIAVECGVLSDEATMINEAFNKFITQGMPLVTIKVAQSLDGKIALQDGSSQWITSKATRDYSHRLRTYHDALLVGLNTVINDNPLLKARYKIIVDSQLRIPLTARIFTPRTGTVIIATTQKAFSAKIRKLKAKGVIVIVLPSRKGKVN
ncbi:bifunctional diaminohydroxyphosphoribosylaminopyrimidine deaminase/5-amino-6-(5-phosphoribosylamino)uracil reductase RibD, partial [Candidatus Omnitrophota bacterium]